MLSVAVSALVADLEAHPECRIHSLVIVNPRGEPIGRHVDGKCYAARGNALADRPSRSGLPPSSRGPSRRT